MIATFSSRHAGESACFASGSTSQQSSSANGSESKKSIEGIWIVSSSCSFTSLSEVSTISEEAHPIDLEEPLLLSSMAVGIFRGGGKSR